MRCKISWKHHKLADLMDITDKYEAKITIHLSNTAHSDPSKYVSPEQNYPFGVRSPTLLPYIGYFHNNLRNGNTPVLWGINPDEHPPKVGTWIFRLCLYWGQTWPTLLGCGHEQLAKFERKIYIPNDVWKVFQSPGKVFMNQKFVLIPKFRVFKPTLSTCSNFKNTSPFGVRTV